VKRLVVVVVVVEGGGGGGGRSRFGGSRIEFFLEEVG